MDKRSLRGEKTNIVLFYVSFYGNNTFLPVAYRYGHKMDFIYISVIKLQSL